MTDTIFNTVTNSLQELLARGIKIIPALLTALIIVMLTRYGAKFVEKVAKKVGRKTL